MSTKVYDAFRFHSGTDFKKLHQFATDLRKKVKEWERDHQINKQIATAVSLYDKHMMRECGWLAPLPEGEAYEDTNYMLSLASRQIKKEKKESEEYGYKTFPLELMVLSQGRFFYGFVRGTQGDTYDKCVKMMSTVADDYSYWNNTDRPDDLSSMQWKRREKVWNEFFNQCSDFRDIATIFPLEQTQAEFNNTYYFGKELRKAKESGDFSALSYVKMPTLESRLKIVTNIHEASWFADLVQQRDRGDTSGYVRVLSELEDGKNKDYNETIDFFKTHFFEELSLVDLYECIGDMKDKMNAKRDKMLAMDVPLELQKPLYQQMKLHLELPANQGVTTRKLKI